MSSKVNKTLELLFVLALSTTNDRMGRKMAEHQP